MDPDVQVIFIGMFFYPLVDLLFSFFERYCTKAKERFERGYYTKMALVAFGWIMFATLMIVAYWKRNWKFVDFDIQIDEDEAKSVTMLLALFAGPVIVWIVYETGIFDDLIDLARSSPMEFSILFASGPILITSGVFKMPSPLFFGQNWIIYFVFLFAFVFYSMVGATAADQDYERDSDERDELELDAIGIGYYWIEGLDGMVMNIEGDKYMFAFSVSNSIRSHFAAGHIVRLDQLPRWILDQLINAIMQRAIIEAVNIFPIPLSYEVDRFFYFIVPPPCCPSEFYNSEENLFSLKIGMHLIEDYPKLKRMIKNRSPNHPFVTTVQYYRQIAMQCYAAYGEMWKNPKKERKSALFYNGRMIIFTST